MSILKPASTFNPRLFSLLLVADLTLAFLPALFVTTSFLADGLRDAGLPADDASSFHIIVDIKYIIDSIQSTESMNTTPTPRTVSERLRVHILGMAPHQKDREQGQLLMDAAGHILHLERELAEAKADWNHAQKAVENVLRLLPDRKTDSWEDAVNGWIAETDKLRTENERLRMHFAKLVKNLTTPELFAEFTMRTAEKALAKEEPK